MRAPGAAWGMYALECAMDELAAKVGIDPLELAAEELRRAGPERRQAVLEQELHACYRQGAERFGWARRNPSRGRCGRATRSSLGHGQRRLGGLTAARGRESRADRDGKLTVSSATAGHRHRHLPIIDPGRGRVARAADGQRDVPARRFVPVESAGRGRVVCVSERRGYLPRELEQALPRTFWQTA